MTLHDEYVACYTMADGRQRVLIALIEEMTGDLRKLADPELSETELFVLTRRIRRTCAAVVQAAEQWKHAEAETQTAFTRYFDAAVFR